MGSARRMTTSSLFVGREAVMTLPGAALRRAADGQGATLVIPGDAGIGKSRITHELEAVANTAGMRTLRGACFPGDRAVPSAWVADMLRRLASDPGDAQAFLAEAAPAFADQVPELRRLGTTVIRGHLLSELPPIQRVPYVLRRLAAVRPTLLIVEDLHWSDASGIEALVASAARAPRSRSSWWRPTVATKRHSNLKKRWLPSIANIWPRRSRSTRSSSPMWR